MDASRSEMNSSVFYDRPNMSLNSNPSVDSMNAIRITTERVQRYRDG